jgi:23S rRNA pseudouridine1911/1915/1917 synthase
VTADEVHEHVVTPAEAGTRLDRLVADLGVVASRSAASRLAERGLVLVDGEPATKKRLVRAGDHVVVTLPPPAETRLLAQELPLDIRYEDEDLIVLSKPAGLVVHPAAGHADGTLVNALLAHCGASLGGAGGSMRPGLVHRLDKDTSGLMMIAKNDAAQATLAAELKDRRVDRRYLTLVNGIVEPDSGVIDAPVGRRPSDRMRMAVTDTAGSREAHTTFRVLERFATSATDDGFTLVECRLRTGRTHQVRVHMAFAGHPVVGDPLYGRADGANPWGLERQFLHAWRLSFEHPRTGERLEFSDLPPEDLAAVLDALEPRSVGRTGAGIELLGPGNGREADYAG